jgi:dTDP-4-dehydrorhamnose reductase
VSALTADRRVRIEGCRVFSLDEGRTADEWMREISPQAVIHCGPASRSSWESVTAAGLDQTVVRDAAEWAAAAQAHAAHFTFVSSDAVFTGPWMFHDEDSECRCPSEEAAVVRQAEAEVIRNCPQSLLIRTNTFGWSPRHGEGWIEQILVDLQRRSLQGYDYIRHGTPILATDLADILRRALDENLSGVHHIAGAERVSPLQFAQRLADHFELPWLSVRRAEEPLAELPAGFGTGECSLQTKKIRKALCVAMPMLSEGLMRLRKQQLSGFTDQFGPDTPAALRLTA